MSYITTIETFLGDDEEPCIIGVLDYDPGYPSYISGPPDDCYEGEGPEVSWQVCDMDGNFCQALHERAQREFDRIDELVIETMERQSRKSC